MDSYVNNELSQRRIKKTIPFTITTKRIKYLGILQIKYLGITLTKDVKDLYSENHKTLKEEIKDTNKWKHISCSQIERIIIFKTPMLPKEIYRFNIIFVKIPITYFTVHEQIFQKFMWNHERPV